FELYGEFGQALGRRPTSPRPQLASLEAALMVLPAGSFHHFGSNAELFAALAAIEGRGPLPGELPEGKPNSDIYILNSSFAFPTRSPAHSHLWVENCVLPPETRLGRRQILTGIPAGFPLPELADGQCLDVAPLDDGSLCLRFYGFEDAFRGAVGEPSTLWLGEPVRQWFQRRGMTLEQAGLDAEEDVAFARLFPVVAPGAASREFIRWLLDGAEGAREDFIRLFLRRRESFARLGEVADMRAVERQRAELMRGCLEAMHRAAPGNAFFRLDLAAAAGAWPEDGPEPKPKGELGGLDAAREAMFLAEVRRRRGGEAGEGARKAFDLLAHLVVSQTRSLWRTPRRRVLDDQIIWGRSPVRLDLAGGWSDTPPYCHTFGGAVVNVAADLNGQPPVQVFLRAIGEPILRLRSIDQGSSIVIRETRDLEDYRQPGDSFALAKAALCLAGFHPSFRPDSVPGSLAKILEEFGGGLEISLLAAAPKGSGLGTSSILAATLLAVLSEACQLGWDASNGIALTLAAEQMLGTGGGWQDQAGGIYPGVKLLESQPGLSQHLVPRWAPATALEAEAGTALLYFTGITRRASGILQEIVRGLFLNSGSHLRSVAAIRGNAAEVYDALLRGSRKELARGVARSWKLNCELDPGTAPPPILAIFSRIHDWIEGGKLLGAGGGGYALFLAKDEEAARRLRRELESAPPNSTARFVNFGISDEGLRVTGS
ncbi:MAG: hypothetical protein N2322_01800, partial [Terrimicrobiaceae bacterium]|nr:hypothetical protein [Terrimicrobiaceae bacterium]